MSYGTAGVRYNGSTVTFHRNKRAAHRGFIYVNRRRVYGTIEWDQWAGTHTFVSNRDAADAALANA